MYGLHREELELVKKQKNEAPDAKEYADLRRKEDLECLEILQKLHRLRLETDYIDGMFLSLRADTDKTDLSEKI
jgi:hypothetical protein